MIRLIQVSKTFGDMQALVSVSLNIQPGKTTVLIGQSGCGKSTLLRLIIGLIRPSSGTIIFAGTEISPQNIRTLRHKMGYVIQEGGLFPHLTGHKNISLLADFLGWEKAKIASRIAELAELTQMSGEFLHRFPAQLSGGQRQRISLMRALMLNPDVLLLDEPLAALDPMIRADLQSDLKRIFQSLQKTVVLVTHDMREAAFLGDTIVLMRAGRIVQQGKLRALLTKPAEPFVTQFINAQRSNFDNFSHQANE
jgi:osmoprotectant transport system ATP-binding protein